MRHRLFDSNQHEIDGEVQFIMMHIKHSESNCKPRKARINIRSNGFAACSRPLERVAILSKKGNISVFSLDRFSIAGRIPSLEFLIDSKVLQATPNVYQYGADTLPVYKFLSVSEAK